MNDIQTQTFDSSVSAISSPSKSPKEWDKRRISTQTPIRIQPPFKGGPASLSPTIYMSTGVESPRKRPPSPIEFEIPERQSFKKNKSKKSLKSKVKSNQTQSMSYSGDKFLKQPYRGCSIEVDFDHRWELFLELKTLDKARTRIYYKTFFEIWKKRLSEKAISKYETELAELENTLAHSNSFPRNISHEYSDDTYSLIRRSRFTQRTLNSNNDSQYSSINASRYGNLSNEAISENKKGYSSDLSQGYSFSSINTTSEQRLDAVRTRYRSDSWKSLPSYSNSNDSMIEQMSPTRQYQYGSSRHRNNSNTSMNNSIHYSKRSNCLGQNGDSTITNAEIPNRTNNIRNNKTFNSKENYSKTNQKSKRQVNTSINSTIDNDELYNRLNKKTNISASVPNKSRYSSNEVKNSRGNEINGTNKNSYTNRKYVQGNKFSSNRQNQIENDYYSDEDEIDSNKNKDEIYRNKALPKYQNETDYIQNDKNIGDKDVGDYIGKNSDESEEMNIDEDELYQNTEVFDNDYNVQNIGEKIGNKSKYHINKQKKKANQINDQKNSYNQNEFNQDIVEKRKMFRINDRERDVASKMKSFNDIGNESSNGVRSNNILRSNMSYGMKTTNNIGNNEFNRVRTIDSAENEELVLMNSDIGGRNNSSGRTRAIHSKEKDISNGTKSFNSRGNDVSRDMRTFSKNVQENRMDDETHIETSRYKSKNANSSRRSHETNNEINRNSRNKSQRIVKRNNSSTARNQAETDSFQYNGSPVRRSSGIQERKSRSVKLSSNKSLGKQNKQSQYQKDQFSLNEDEFDENSEELYQLEKTFSNRNDANLAKDVASKLYQISRINESVSEEISNEQKRSSSVEKIKEIRSKTSSENKLVTERLKTNVSFNQIDDVDFPQDLINDIFTPHSQRRNEYLNQSSLSAFLDDD